MIHHPTDCSCAAHAPRRAPKRRPHVEDTTLGSRSATDALRRRLMARFARAYATWERTVAAAPEGNKAILRAAEDALGRAFHAAIDATWADAYRLGYGSRAGGAAPALPPSFLGDIDRQRRFATAFAQDIAAGTVGKKGRMPFGQRAGLYANGIEGAFNAGAVDAGVEGELIYWRLGSSDHCIADADALVLTKDGLVRIADVVPGLLVWTHRGRWRRVVATHAVRVLDTSAGDTLFSVECGGRRLLVTDNHELLTESGWKRADRVASDLSNPLQFAHVRHLHSMFWPDEIPQPHLREVPTDMRMRSPEGAPLGGVHGLRRARKGREERNPQQGEGATGGRTAPKADTRAEHHLRADRGSPLPSFWGAVRRQFSEGGRARGDCAATSVEVGEGKRANPGRDGGSPHRRGQDQRRVGELAVDGRRRPSADAHLDRGRVGFVGAVCVRNVRDCSDVYGQGARKDRQSLLQSSVPRQVVEHSQRRGTDREVVPLVWNDVSGLALGCEPAEELLASVQREVASVQPDRQVREYEIVYDLTVEEDHSYIANGFIVANCSSCPLLAASSPYTRATLPTVPRAGATPCGNNCKCHLEFTPTAGRRAPPPAPTSNPDDVLNPPPPGPGQRRPTPEEEARLRDLEIAAQEAARKAANAKRIADREKWKRRADDATRERDRIADEGNIAIPPGLPAEAVITGATIGESGIMDLARARGIDGPTAARGRDAVDKAIAGSITSLAGLFAALAAFGTGFVTTVSPDEPEDGDEGTLLREAVAPVDGGARVLVSVVGEGLEGTLRNHLEALRVLAAGGHAVEVGPYGARWPELVAALGTWVVGARADVDSFLTEWGKSAYGRSGLAVAPWRERA